uniref:Small G protein signaling modulator 2 n=1 Tax=Maylandia zebra TaxID=106582 RepID=A0A3P9BW41_9CICH
LAQFVADRCTPVTLMLLIQHTCFSFSIYWDYALTVPLRQIVCIHCHQRCDQDGIQRPPLHFPPGGHLLAFLSCLETGLLPRGQLEPPLWSQKGKGKVFPKLRKRSSAARLIDQEANGEEQSAADYVFRIVYPGYRYEANHGDMMDTQGFGGSPSSWQQAEVTTHESLCQSCSTCIPLKMLCQNMKRQIVSRAFYGCKHTLFLRFFLTPKKVLGLNPPCAGAFCAEFACSARVSSHSPNTRS